MSSRLRVVRVVLCLGWLVIVSGCMDPQFAEVHWSERAVTEKPVAAPREALRGRLVVRTERYPHDGGGDGYDHQGYAVFDRQGALVLNVLGVYGERDSVPLRPGRYIVVAHVLGDALVGTLESAQVVVSEDDVTFVDLSRPRQDRASGASR